MSQTNILLFYTYEEPTVTFGIQYFQLFCERFGSNLRYAQVNNITLADIAWSDVVIGFRCQSALEAGIARIANKAGRKVALVIDDDFFAIPHYGFRRRQEARALQTYLTYTHLVIACNDTLGERMCGRSVAARYVRTDTLIQPRQLAPLKEQSGNKLHVLYYCNDGSVGPFESVFTDMLPTLADRFGKNLEWTFIATHPNFGGYEDKMHVNYLPHLSYEAFQKLLSEGDFNLGVAPLQNDRFSQCKYNNKLIEYTKAGLPCIYSKVSPYTESIRDGENGILCENTVESWVQAFTKMGTDPDLRREIAHNAQKDILEHYSAEVLLERMHRDAPELTGFKADAQRKPTGLFAAKLQAIADRVTTPFTRTYARLRLEGMGSVLRWIVGHYIFKRI